MNITTNAKIEERILDAMEKQEPKEPRRIELGGGYYYKCFWMSCDADLNQFMRYCPLCGQKIDWSYK